MNNIRAIEALNQRELEAGIPPSASWHTDWADTAYVYIGGLPYELSEGDIITIFSQFGEPVHVNLIRDKDTGKSKGFAFLKYEDQRSTSLAVDNLGGATILGRVIRVDHTRYEPKEGEVVDENAQRNSGEKPTDEGDKEWRGKRRRRRDDDSGGDDDRRKRSPPREVLKEELELQKLIRDHDDEDPMKEYLIRQKKEDLEKALGDLKNEKKSSKHRHDKERGDRNEHGHRYHRSKASSRRHRSRSKDYRRPAKPHKGTDHARDQDRGTHQGRTGDKDKAAQKETREGSMSGEADMTNGEKGKERNLGSAAVNI